MEPVRGDIADIRLADRVFAPHYAVALACHAATRADILARADDPGSALSEILPGETFEVLELATGHAWGRCAADGAVGYVPRAALAHGPPPAAAPAPAALPDDPVTVAERLVGTPGRAGGRSPGGMDSAGLIFYALTAAGLDCPRFLDHQIALGHDAGPEPRRGDLLFFADHAAIHVGGDAVVQVGADLAPVERVSLADAITAFGPVAARRRLA